MGKLAQPPPEDRKVRPRGDEWIGRSMLMSALLIVVMGISFLAYIWVAKSCHECHPIKPDSPLLDADDDLDSVIPNSDVDPNEAENFDDSASVEFPSQAGDEMAVLKVPFVLSKEKASAFVAQSRCDRKGMRLVEIRNEKVAANVLKVLSEETEAFWISGVKDASFEDVFKEGTKKLTDWQFSQLYDNFNTLKTVCLSLESFGWTWDLKYRIVSALCIRKKRYICEVYQ